MKFPRIKYVGSLLDFSGYGNAARKNVIAIKENGIHVCGTNVSFAANESLIDPAELLKVDEIISSQIDYNVVIQHLTPENYQHFIEPGKFNVGHTVWEANLIHPAWIPPLNKMDLILVPCKWNVEVMADYSVKTKTIVYPHAFNTKMFEGVKPHPITVARKDKLKFYSIFQWSERKNPVGLIRSFCSTFSAGDECCLFLKTYAGSGSTSDLNWLKGEIEKAISSVGKTKESLPEIVLLTNLTSDDKIRQLHAGCDVYLAPARGEGFAISSFEAALAGNHVITTNYGGHTDFLPADIYDLIPYQLTPVAGMPHIKWYTADMYWADPDLSAFCNKMRDAYDGWKRYGVVPRAPLRALHSEKMMLDYSYKKVTQNLIRDLEKYL